MELTCDFAFTTSGSTVDFNFTDFKSAYSITGEHDASKPFEVSYTTGSQAGSVDTSSGSYVMRFPKSSAYLYWITFKYKPDGSSSRLVSATVHPSSASPSGTAPAITTASLPSTTADSSYTQTLAATSTTPITWAVSAGSLPAGLTLSTNGSISGTPTSSGTSTFTVKATNTAGNDTKQFTITVNSAPPSSVTLYVTGTGKIPNPGSSKIFHAPSGKSYTFKTVDNALKFAQNPRSYIEDNYPGWSESAGYGYADVLMSAISTIVIVLDITEVGENEYISGYWDEVKEVTIMASNPSRAIKSPNTFTPHFNIREACENLIFMDITFSETSVGESTYTTRRMSCSAG